MQLLKDPPRLVFTCFPPFPFSSSPNSEAFVLSLAVSILLEDIVFFDLTITLPYS